MTKSANQKERKIKICIVAVIGLIAAAVTIAYLLIASANINTSKTESESMFGPDTSIPDASDSDSADSDIPDASSDDVLARDSYTLVSNSELEEIINRSTVSVVYVGRPTCPHCAQFSPILIEFIQETGKLIYHYNTDEAKIDNREQFSALVEQLDISAVPALIKVQNGAKIAELDDYSSIEAIRNFLDQ